MRRDGCQQPHRLSMGGASGGAAWYAREAGRTAQEEELVAALERAATTSLGRVTGP